MAETSQVSAAAVRPRFSIYSTRLHLVMYTLLLIATPFLMLRRYMQDAVGVFSRWSFPFAGMSIPIIPIIAGVVLVSILVGFRRKIRRLHLAALGIGFVMIAMGQSVTDYYFNHQFYDLQQNWHYLAYSIFAVMVFRDLAPRGLGMARIMQITFLCALAFSTFDEAFQLKINFRIFDIGDVAKDVWGAMIGMAVVYMGDNRLGAMLRRREPIRHDTLRGYLESPWSTFLLLGTFSYLLLCIGSLLTESVYIGLAVGITLAVYVFVLALVHMSRTRWGGRIVIGALVACALAAGVRAIGSRDHLVSAPRYGWTLYRGVPIPFFDVLVLPSGRARLVDKKEHFNQRDRYFFMRQRADILVVGSGWYSKGGHGFPEERISQFNWNRFTERGTHVLVLPTPQAVDTYNRLRREGKRVMLVLHSTC